MADLTTNSPAGLMRDYIIRYLGEVAPTVLNGWGWSIGKMPDTPDTLDKLITLIDQSGPTSFPHLLVDYPGLQVLVRSSRGGVGYNDSYLMARTIRDAILGMEGHPAEFPELDGVTERGNITPLGFDDKDRHVWSDNFQLLVEPEVNAVSHRASL